MHDRVQLTIFEMSPIYMTNLETGKSEYSKSSVTVNEFIQLLLDTT